MNSPAFHTHPTPPGETPKIRRILVVKLSSLGDLFHALPAVDQLRRGLGAEIVDWVTQTEYAELVTRFSGVRRVIAFPRRRFAQQARSFLTELRQDSYDLVLDFQGLMKSALVARWARAPRRVGPSFRREGTQVLYTDAPAPGDGLRHAVDRCLDTVRHLGIELGPAQFPIEFPPVETLDDACTHVAVAPCSRWKAKDWPVAKFAEVMNRLQADRDIHWYLVGSPADRETSGVLQRMVQGTVTNLCGKTSLMDLGGWLRQMSALLTNDSGPMHFAVAAGTPVVALFGPTDPGRTGPYGPAHRVLRPELDAGEEPPDHRAYKSDDDQYMQRISVDRVLQALREVLG